MSNLEPITRKEQYLNRLTGEEQAIPETPVTRTEQYLAKLCGEEIEIPSSPITREETYLAYLNGEDVTLPEPITRLEQFMAFAAGESETKPTPLTREEFYWDKYQGGEVLKDFPGLPASIVTVTDAVAKPLDSLKVAITPVQSGSGDPSPENVRPISGWTECNIRVGSENFYNNGNVEAQSTAANVTLYGNSGLRVYRRGTSTGRYPSSKQLLSNYRLTSGKTYILMAYATITSGTAKIGIRDENNGLLTSTLSTVTDGRIMLKFVYQTEMNYISFFAAFNETSGGDVMYSDIKFFEEKEDIPITFPTEAGTVYGGTLDVVNGTLTVNRKLLNTKDTSWSSYNGVFYIPSWSEHTNTSVRPIAEQYVTGPNANGMGVTSGWDDQSIRQNTSGNSIYIKDSRFSSVRDFKNNANVNFVYSLATPVTYQLTPTEVQMLLGTNNLWADTGDILEGKYWGKNSSATRAMLNTLLDAGEITPTEEPEENDER